MALSKQLSLTLLGGNVLHSFSGFPIPAGQSITFTDAAPAGQVNNIINRVTGGAPSQIEGAFNSTVAGADVFLINPNGVVFGEGSSVDVPAGLHISTAHELRLGDGSAVSAVAPNMSLSSAPPAAFGFVGPNSSALEFIGAKIAAKTDAAISLVGGDVVIKAAASGAPSAIETHGGTLQIAAIKGAGSAPVDPRVSAPLASSFGSITITDSDVQIYRTHASSQGGAMFVRGGSLLLEGAVNLATHSSSGAGGDVNLDIDGTIELKGDRSANKLAAIRSAATGTGDGGDLDINADKLLFSSHALVETANGGDGIGGNIEFTVPSVEILAEGLVRSVTDNGSGRGGDILLEASRQLTADWTVNLGNTGFVGIISQTTGASTGRSGDIKIDTPMLRIAGGLQRGYGISTVTETSAASGHISITADSIFLDQFGFILTQSLSSGDSGNISVIAKGAITSRQGQIGGNTSSLGRGGDISIQGEDVIFESGSANVATDGIGKAGNISITARNNFIMRSSNGIRDAGVVSASSVGASNSGDAGNVTISAKNIYISDRAQIISRSDTGADGGNIILDAREAIDIANSSVNATANGTGGPGNITVRAPRISMAGASVENTALESSRPGTPGSIRLLGDFILLETVQHIVQSQTRQLAIIGTTFGARDAASIYIGGYLPDSRAKTFMFTASTRFPGTRAGSISSITTGDLDGNIYSITGRSGDITIMADDVTLSNAGISNQALSDPRPYLQPDMSDIKIIAKNVHLQNFNISTDNSTSGLGGSVLIKVDDDGGFIATSSVISSSSRWSGGGGRILIDAGTIDINSESQLLATTIGTGPAGAVELQGRNTRIDGSVISTISPRFDSGDAGNITLFSTESIGIMNSRISSRNGNNSKSRAGAIVIDAASVLIYERSTIDSRTGGSGSAGNIRIGQLGYLENLDVRDSTIFSLSTRDGFASDVLVDARVISLVNTSIESGSTGPGAGGSIRVGRVVPVESLTLSSSRLSASTRGSAIFGSSAGSVEIRSAGGVLDMTNSFIATDSNTAGRSGAISIGFLAGDKSAAKLSGDGFADIILRECSRILTQAASSVAGDIDILATNNLLVYESQIVSEVLGGTGNGGDISIDPINTVLRNAVVDSSSAGGAGGSVTIETAFFFASESVLDLAGGAANGQLLVTGPEIGASTVQSFDPAISNVAERLPAECARRLGAVAGTLTPEGRGGLPLSADLAGGLSGGGFLASFGELELAGPGSDRRGFSGAHRAPGGATLLLAAGCN